MSTVFCSAKIEVLKSLIKRIENIEDEKTLATLKIADLYAQAKESGFDPKIMRAIVNLRKTPRDEDDYQEHLLDLYCETSGENS